VIYVTGNIEMVACRGSPIVDKPIAIHALAAARIEAGIAAGPSHRMRLTGPYGLNLAAR
jgi:hypothetical protein